jgi:antagonist of KipI
MSGPSPGAVELPARIAEAEFPAGRPALVKRGEELEFDPSERGGRAWIAIAGGIDVPLVLGSRSTDLRSSFGGFEGRALRDGDVLPLGKTARGKEDARLASWTAPVDWAQTAMRAAVLRVVEGSEWDEFVPEAQTAF